MGPHLCGWRGPLLPWTPALLHPCRVPVGRGLASLSPTSCDGMPPAHGLLHVHVNWATCLPLHGQQCHRPVHPGGGTVPRSPLWGPDPGVWGTLSAVLRGVLGGLWGQHQCLPPGGRLQCLGGGPGLLRRQRQTANSPDRAQPQLCHFVTLTSGRCLSDSVKWTLSPPTQQTLGDQMRQ